MLVRLDWNINRGSTQLKTAKADRLDWNLNTAAQYYSTTIAETKTSALHTPTISLSCRCRKPPGVILRQQKLQRKQTAPHQEGHRHTGPFTVPLQHHTSSSLLYLREKIFVDWHLQILAVAASQILLGRCICVNHLCIN
jgi:hypothetical protein